MISCKRCKLSTSRLCIVRALGPSPADALFMIDAPSSADERLKEVGRTPQGRLIGALVYEAAEMLGIEKPTYQIVPMVFCRPWNVLSGLDRQPSRSEILACVPNVLDQIQKCNPAQIFFCGQDVANYWKREFPEGKIISAIWLLEKQGGIQSPSFTQNARIIAEGFKHVVARNKRLNNSTDNIDRNKRVNPDHFDF